jgi:uncharacterized membrane protein YccC
MQTHVFIIVSAEEWYLFYTYYLFLEFMAGVLTVKDQIIEMTQENQHIAADRKIKRAEIYNKFRIIAKAMILTAVILISYFVGYGITFLLNIPGTSNYISGLWCAVTAVVVFDDMPTNAVTLMKDRLLGTFTGAALSALCIALFGHVIFSISIALFIVCVLIIFFKLNGALKIACTTVLIVGVSTHNYSNHAIWLYATMRFFESAIGGLISLAATIVIDRSKKYFL